MTLVGQPCRSITEKNRNSCLLTQYLIDPAIRTEEELGYAIRSLDITINLSGLWRTTVPLKSLKLAAAQTERLRSLMSRRLI
jgi:hypothetical protein